MKTSVHECYGYRVVCAYDLEAEPAVRGFFGPEAGAGTRFASAATLSVTFRVSGELTGAPVDPPHNLEVMMGDPVSVDVGSSKARLEPRTAVAEVTLGRGDVDNQIVWGRFIMERLFVYLVCRSPRHYPLHAGAIAVDGRIAVVTAAGGVGKSTFTFWAWHRGADLIGEDIMVRHLDDPSGSLWGYPRALYLSPEMLGRSPELAGAAVSTMDVGKCRVTIPDALTTRLRSQGGPACLIFLVRGQAGADVRPVALDDAIERCRADFAIAKEGAALVAVEADLRSLFGDRPLWELEVSDDLDESYERLRTALRRVAVPG